MHRPWFDEQDLRLLHGLQISPRVSWADAARALGSTPATAAARWERLRAEGLAWVVAHPSGRVGSTTAAFIEVDCRPGRRDDVIRSLREDARVVTIEQAARGRDLLLTVMTPDLRSLTRFALDDLPRVDGVQRQQTFLATAIHRQASDWRLGALDRDQQAAFEATRSPAPSTPVSLPREAWPLIRALGRDGRANAADLARATGRNHATVRRQLARLLATGALALRCEVAQDESLWPLHCTWLARVPEPEKERTLTALATLPELRLCVSTTGETNLQIAVWAKSQSDLLRLERLLGERLPWLTIKESVINLRTAKRMGWFIDDRGRATGEVMVPTALAPSAG